MIYLASPYSHPDPLIMRTRYLLAEQVTAGLLAKSLWTYSPIVHCHELAARHSLPTDFAYWQEYNIDMLRRCDRFYALSIPGWRKSKGVAGESAVAHMLNLPMALINEEGVVTPWPVL